MSRPVSRVATPEDVPALAALWHAGWHEAHAAVVPATLTALRTLDSFKDRLGRALPRVRVADGKAQPLGFYWLTRDELDQFFVAAQARGTGLAQQLIADAETELQGQGHSRVHLFCAIGNTRAERFYTKCGWVNIGVVDASFDSSAGRFEMKAWRFEKTL